MSAPPKIPSAEGASFIGFIIATSLYGWFLSQSFAYYRRCRSDHSLVKVAVAAIIATETVSTVTTATSLYHDLILNFGNITDIEHVSETIRIYQLAGSLTIFIVQSFYAYRLYRLNDGTNVPVIPILFMMTLAAASFTLSMIVTIRLFLTGAVPKIETPVMQALFSSELGSAAACDLAVTWALCRYLAASRTGIKATENAILRMASYVLSRGVVLVVFQIVSMVVFLSTKNVLIYLTFHQIAVKLYANSLVAFLLEFEPYRLDLRTAARTVRADDPSLYPSGPASARSIHLEVMQSTEEYVYTPQHSAGKGSYPGQLPLENKGRV